MTEYIGKLMNHNEDPSTKVGDTRLLTLDRVGIEVELEDVAHKIQRDPFKYWRVTEDGSLRDNGLEFVFRAPLAGIDVVKAVIELEDAMSVIKPQISERTSVHVHLDVRDMSPSQLFSLLVTYAFVERTMMRYCGESRMKNNFCLPISSTSADFLSRISRFKQTEGRDFIHQAQQFNDNERYAALNISAINTYGSIEFRGYHGTYDAQEILTWVNMILSLKKFAIENAEDVFRNFHVHISANGALQVFNSIFNRVLAERLTTDYLMHDLRESIVTVQDILFNWDIVLEASQVLRKNQGAGMVYKFMEKHNNALFRAYKEQGLVTGSISIDELLVDTPVTAWGATNRVRVGVRPTPVFTAPEEPTEDEEEDDE